MKKLMVIITLISAVFIMSLFTSCSKPGGESSEETSEGSVISEVSSEAEDISSDSETSSIIEESSYDEESSDAEESSQVTSSSDTSSEPELPEYIPGSIPLYDIENDPMFSYMKYRFVWYMSGTSYRFDIDDIEWKYYIDNIENPDSETTMMVQFIQYFDISKEDFEEVMKKTAIGYGDRLNMDEFYEVPNADIFYTFDNDIINHYYRRE